VSSAEERDLMGANMTLQKGSEAILGLEAKESSKATFDLSYLAEIIKAASATSDIATLEFSEFAKNDYAKYRFLNACMQKRSTLA
jgi:hypothetical protein